jgi:hypothetical protein
MHLGAAAKVRSTRLANAGRPIGTGAGGNAVELFLAALAGGNDCGMTAPFVPSILVLSKRVEGTIRWVRPCRMTKSQRAAS